MGLWTPWPGVLVSGLSSLAAFVNNVSIELLETRFNNSLGNDAHQCSSDASPRHDRATDDQQAAEAIGPAVLMLVQELHQLNSNLTNSLPQRYTTTRSSPSAPVSPSVSNSQTDLHGQNRRKRTRIDDTAEISQPNQQTTYQPHPSTEDRGQGHLLWEQTFLRTLLNAYYNNIHPWIPILQEDQSRIRLLDTQKHQQNLIILHAIFFAAHRFIRDESLSAIDLMDMAKRSREYVVLHAMDDLTLENLQALIIIVFIDVSSLIIATSDCEYSHQFSAW